jgi:hypothetical protein
MEEDGTGIDVVMDDLDDATTGITKSHDEPVSATSLEYGFHHLHQQQDQQVQDSLTLPDQPTADVKNEEDEAIVIDMMSHSNNNDDDDDDDVDTFGVNNLQENIALPIQTYDNAIQTEIDAHTENNNTNKPDMDMYSGLVKPSSEINHIHVEQEDIRIMDVVNDVSDNGTGTNQRLIYDGVNATSYEIPVHGSNKKIDDEINDQGIVTLTEPLTNEVILNDNEDSFGDFDHAEIVNDNNNNIHEKTDNFGDFNTQSETQNGTTSTNQSNKVVYANNESNDGDDEFGDFDTAIPSLVVTTIENIQVPEVVDDDDFGDFDEAPVTIHQNVETTNFSLSSTTYGNPHDPIIEKLKTMLPSLFYQYIDKHHTLEPTTDASDDHVVKESVPDFTDNEMISIENVMVRTRFLHMSMLKIGHGHGNAQKLSSLYLTMKVFSLIFTLLLMSMTDVN